MTWKSVSNLFTTLIWLDQSDYCSTVNKIQVIWLMHQWGEDYHTVDRHLYLSLALLQFHYACICITFHLIHSQFGWHLSALFNCDSLSFFHFLSALVPLLHFPCCHHSLTPCLSVILCLIAIDRYWSHLRTNLIKSDKRRYFYWFIQNTPTCANESTPTTYIPIHTDTHPLNNILDL